MFVGYLIVTDNSISYAFALVLNFIKFQYEKQKWWLLHNPRNIIVRWMIDRNSMKMAKELMEEFEEKNK